jgi:hypothetical protein
MISIKNFQLEIRNGRAQAAQSAQRKWTSRAFFARSQSIAEAMEASAEGAFVNS